MAPAPVAPAADTAKVRRCDPGDLETALGENAATGGQLFLTVMFRNRSETDCYLSGAPEVRLLDERGDGIALRSAGVQPVAPALLAAGAPPLRPGFPEAGQAYWAMSWHIHDGAGACLAPPPAVATVVLKLAAGDLPRNPVLSVWGARRWQFAVPAVRRRVRGRTVCGRAAACTGAVRHEYPISAALALPDTVRAGSTLRFTVTLTNTGDVPVSWDAECPTYRMGLPALSVNVPGPERFLNCVGSGPLLPGQGMSFAMELPVPADAAVGATRVFWDLDLSFAYKAVAEGTVTVVR